MRAGPLPVAVRTQPTAASAPALKRRCCRISAAARTRRSAAIAQAVAAGMAIAAGSVVAAAIALASARCHVSDRSRRMTCARRRNPATADPRPGQRLAHHQGGDAGRPAVRATPSSRPISAFARDYLVDLVGGAGLYTAIPVPGSATYANEAVDRHAGAARRQAADPQQRRLWRPADRDLRGASARPTRSSARRRSRRPRPRQFEAALVADPAITHVHGRPLRDQHRGAEPARAGGRALPRACARAC